MPRKILIQAGHQNIVNGQTGAPGELAANIRFRDKVSEILLSKFPNDFQLFLCDANFTSTEDYDLALAIHCDANVYGTGGGFIDYPDPSVDGVNATSKSIRDAMATEYFDHSGIVNHPERSNPNTKFYYWWSMLSAKTPCVIIETCVIQDPHDSVIAADPAIIPSAIARGICKAFGVVYDIQPTPPPPVQPPTMPPTHDYKTDLSTIKNIITSSGWWYRRFINTQKIMKVLADAGI